MDKKAGLLSLFMLGAASSVGLAEEQAPAPPVSTAPPLPAAPDVCPNIGGDQPAIPGGMEKDPQTGNCVLSKEVANATRSYSTGTGGRRGAGLLTTGAVFSGLGIAFMAAGGGMLGASGKDLGLAVGGAGLFIVAGVHLIIGIPMLGVGGYRYNQPGN